MACFADPLVSDDALLAGRTRHQSAATADVRLGPTDAGDLVGSGAEVPTVVAGATGVSGGEEQRNVATARVGGDVTTFDRVGVGAEPGSSRAGLAGTSGERRAAAARVGRWVVADGPVGIARVTLPGAGARPTGLSQLHPERRAATARVQAVVGAHTSYGVRAGADDPPAETGTTRRARVRRQHTEAAARVLPDAAASNGCVGLTRPDSVGSPARGAQATGLAGKLDAASARRRLRRLGAGELRAGAGEPPVVTGSARGIRLACEQTATAARIRLGRAGTAQRVGAVAEQHAVLASTARAARGCHRAVVDERQLPSAEVARPDIVAWADIGRRIGGRCVAGPVARSVREHVAARHVDARIGDAGVRTHAPLPGPVGTAWCDPEAAVGTATGDLDSVRTLRTAAARQRERRREEYRRCGGGEPGRAKNEKHARPPHGCEPRIRSGRYAAVASGSIGRGGVPNSAPPSVEPQRRSRGGASLYRARPIDGRPLRRLHRHV